MNIINNGNSFQVPMTPSIFAVEIKIQTEYKCHEEN